jgi:hypothetical protein
MHTLKGLVRVGNHRFFTEVIYPNFGSRIPKPSNNLPLQLTLSEEEKANKKTPPRQRGSKKK